VEDPTSKADLIVFFPDEPVANSLQVSDLFQNGVAQRIFVPRGHPEAGSLELRKRGGIYPEQRKLLMGAIQSLGVPAAALVTGERAVWNVPELAIVVRDFVQTERIKSLVLVPSPLHSRRAIWTFKRVFEGTGIKINVMPSGYTGFDPEHWWKQRALRLKVFKECQRLIYYRLKYL
jgi:uncharacterized SAM-binding protein YcdF (DUF218 family)